MFIRYQHVERLGTDEVDGILLGNCYVFPKLDGTNSSVWLNEDGTLGCGSRNRNLTLDYDNQGFMSYIYSEKENNFKKLFQEHPSYHVYGEWLVPHSLKTYRVGAWKKFYVFDICVKTEEGLEYINYDVYKDILEKYEIDYIPCMAKIINPDVERLYRWLSANNFLIEDGKGAGEGIVIKNYEYHNKYGRQTWAKIVTSEFKEKNQRVMGPSLQVGKYMVEEDIVVEYCTNALIEKTKAKIENEKGEWKSEFIPILFGMVFHELVVEEIWHIVKKYKQPTINFKLLYQFVVKKVKEQVL